MNLQERLQSLQSLGLLKSEKREKPVKDSSLAEYLGGRLTSNSKGEYLLIEKSYGQAYRHGIVCVSDLLGADARTISLLAKTQLPKEIDFNRAIFLDTETTGFAGGFSHYSFLEGDGF